MNRQQRPLALFTAVVMIVLVLLFSGTHAQSSDGCFLETGFCIEGRIREFWENNGKLPVFGLPITPQQGDVIEGRSLEVQWFERNRLELHPENDPPYDVLLGRLGVDVLEKNGRDWKSFPKETPKAGCEFFEQTGFNVCSPILERWQNPKSQSGDPLPLSSIELYGLPISPLQWETLEGKEYQVQWFERARFELHPNNDPPHNVLLGLLGNEMYTDDTTPVDGPENDRPITDVIPSNQYISFFSDGQGIRKLVGGSTESIVITTEKFDRDPAWSPDNTKIAFSSIQEGEKTWSTYVMNSDGSGRIRIGHGLFPDWSPDGSKIAVHHDTYGEHKVFHIYVLNADGSGSSQLTTHVAGKAQFPSWSPDGTKIVYQFAEGDKWQIHVMNADGTSQTLISPNPTGGENPQANDMRPSWSRDGSKIAFQSDRSGTMNIHVMDANGSNIKRLTQTSLANNDPHWSADNTKIVFSSSRTGNWKIYGMNADGSGQTRLMSSDHQQDERNPSWSSRVPGEPITPAPPFPNQPVEEVEGPGGKIAYMAEVGGARDIFVMNSSGSGKTNITNTPADEFAPAWSPDGSKIAFTSKRDGNWEIYVANADGSNPIRLTDHVEADTYPAWSPDGSLIAFNSERTGYADIYLVKSDGSSTEPINLTNSTSYEWKPAWSPNGQYIAFDSTRDGNAEIYMLEVANPSNQIRLTNDPGEDEYPAWSHDGQWIAFQSTRGGGTTYDIYIMDINGGSVRNITDNPSHNMHPAWSPDDTHITFMSNRDGSEDIFVISIEGYGDNNLTNTPGDERFPAWTR